MRLKGTFGVMLVLAGLVVPLLVGTYHVQQRMNRIRVEERLTDTEPLLNAPPLVAFTTVALGGFRGLVADWLWLRSQKMQDEGNYFEMVQLASWIVKLQPRFTGASAFLAWNMAYNISVTFNSFEDRWKWVQRGIELIRDEALFYNPGDPDLFHELGWIYQHKLGRDLDDANRFYKTQMAREVIKVLGGYPPDWDRLIAAPRTVEQLRERLGPDTTLWRSLEANVLTFETVEHEFRKTGELPTALKAALGETGDRSVLELCLRRRWLEDGLKLDPARIKVLNAKYGGLDWRLPEAHAIYWANRGLEAARGDLSVKCDRMIFQSLAAAYKAGRLVCVGEPQNWETMPNLGLVDAVNQSYVDAMEKHGRSIIQGAYQNFLVDAIVELYTFGQQKKAQEYFEKGRKEFGKGRFYKTLDEFVLEELAKDMALASFELAQGAIQGYLLQSCHALAIGENDAAVTFERIAARIWQKYTSEIGETTTERRGLPPYEQMKVNVVQRALEVFPPDTAQRLRAALPQGKEALKFADSPSASVPTP